MAHTVAQIRKGDPSRTTRIRKRFAGEAAYRFRVLGDTIKAALVDLDVLGLQDGVFLAANRKKRDGIGTVDISPPKPKEWAARTDSAKVEEFAAWLDDQANRGVLGIIVKRGSKVVERDEWANVYIDNAAKKAIVQARTEMAKAGITGASGLAATSTAATIALQSPIHANRVKMIYTRVYSDLEGITAEMEKQIRRELANGLSEGLNPRDIARRLTNRVEKIGVTRSKLLARTEVIRAHAEGTLTEFEAFGVEGVDLGVEFHTASDPCPVCLAKRESLPILSPKEARGIIPVHPNCRCVWLPAPVEE